MPRRLTRPTVGFRPTTPFTDAGQMMLPFVSVPIATDARLAAAATAEPELDPHGLRSSTCGFFVCPPRELHPDVDLRRAEVGPLAEVGPAEDDDARIAQPPDDERIRLGTVVGKRQRSGRIDHAGDVDVVLDQNRDAVQRPADLARLPLGITRLGVPNRGGIEVDHRIELRARIINRSDAIEIRARQRTRGERSCRHASLRLGDAQVDDVDLRRGSLRVDRPTHAALNQEGREERDNDTLRHRGHQGNEFTTLPALATGPTPWGIGFAEEGAVGCRPRSPWRRLVSLAPPCL